MEYNKNKDYAEILDYLIKGGASKDEVKEVLDLRIRKIDENPELEKYRYDDSAKKALDYINKPDAKTQKEEVINNYNNAIDSSVSTQVDTIREEMNELDDYYDDEKAKIYHNARLSAIGNNERLAQRGFTKGLYDGASSGYGEIMRANLDANLQNNLISAEKEKQKKISELNKEIRKALDDGEIKKAQNLIDTAYKYDFEAYDQYDKDREFEAEKAQQQKENEYNERDFLAEQNQIKKENEYNERDFEAKQKQQQFDNEIKKEDAMLDNILDNQKIQNAKNNDFKNSAVYKEIISKIYMGKYSLSAIIESYMPVLKNYSSDALLEIADAYYDYQKNLK
ncbi:MAG: hypothetical protein IKZ25_04075 [Clostridia bacterium]|nr:hypothetical protein [Clostridia bacterium]